MNFTASRLSRAAGVVVLCVSCDGGPARVDLPTASSIHFTEVAVASGIDFVTTSGKTPARQILEVKGGGVGLIDFDDDGDLDVFVPNGATLEVPVRGPGCRLFENLGSLQFRDATESAGLRFDRWGIGVAVGDIDSDGHDDIYITCYGPNALLRNTGDGRFEEITESAGVGGGSVWSAAAAFGDLDGDGDLDLHVANYLDFDIAHPPGPSWFKGAPVFRGPHGLPPEHDLLYENLGGGRFRDISEQAGLREATPAYGLGTVILDFTGDGRPDIYVGNDSTPNFLWVNQGDLKFVERGVATGIAFNVDGSEQSTMGIAIADVSGNGFPDLFTTNFSNDTNTLHVNHEGRFFDDETRRYGLGMLSFPYVGWAAEFHDFDHDGDEDLLIFNGHVYPNASIESMDSTLREPALLYRREDAGFSRVESVEAGPWLDELHCDRGAAFGDLDGDGDIDVVVTELGGRVRLLRNDCKAAGWLIVELVGNAFGSKVEVTAGAALVRRFVHSGGSFISASASAAHFGGLGAVTTVDLEITWPDGHRQRRDGVAIDQHLVVDRDSGENR